MTLPITKTPEGRAGRPPRLNRWTILVASLVVMFCTGAMYSFSVLRDPLVADKGFPLSVVLLAYSVNAGLAPLPMILGGRLIDRGHARWVVLAGGLLFGLGWVIAGLATSPWQLIVGYGLVAGTGQGLGYGACLANNLRLFPDRRGLAAGLSIAANGGATVLVAPIARNIIEARGAGQAMVILGVAFFVASGAATILIKTAPATYRPPGWSPPASQPGVAAPTTSVPPMTMLRRPEFWLIFAIFVCGAFSGVMIAANASPIGVAMFGLTTAAAALAVSGYSAGKATGAFAFGAICDRVGPIRALAAIFAAVVVFCGVLALAHSQGWLFFVAIPGLGLCFGGVMAVMPTLVNRRFGSEHQGTNYGIAFGGYALAAFISPELAAEVGAGGDYTLAFLIAIGAALVGLALIAVLARRVEPGRRRADAG